MISVQYFSILLSALSVAWAVYSFSLNKRQKQSEETKADIFRTISILKEQQEKALADTQRTVSSLQYEIGKLKEFVVQASTKADVTAQSIKEDIERIEKNIDRQQAKLDGFGRVTLKD